MGRVRDTEAQQRILDTTVELIGARDRRSADRRHRPRPGVGKQTIYRWWPSKNAVIIDAILDQSTKETPFRDTGDARRDLRAHMRGVARLFASPLGALIKEVLAEASADPTIAQEFVEGFGQPSTRPLDCVASSIDSPGPSPSRPPTRRVYWTDLLASLGAAANRSQADPPQIGGRGLDLVWRD